MPSHLTRSVFRRLLLNEPLIFHCPTQSTRFRYIRHGPRSVFRIVPQRTIFGFSRQPPRQPRAPELDPGLRIMLDLNVIEKSQARPPPPSELIKAFNTFISHKYRTKAALNNIQAQHVLRTFKHLQRTNAEEEGFGLSLEDLRLTARVLLRIPKDRVSTHNELARVLYTEILKRKTLGELNEDHLDLRHYVQLLASTGDALEARDYVQKFWEEYQPESATQKSVAKTGRKLWLSVLSGFARDGNEAELLKTAQIAEDMGMPYLFSFQEVMTVFYAQRDNIEATRKWYRKGAGGWSPQPTAKTLSELLKFSMRNKELDWCKQVFRDVLESNPTKETWDVVFQWAAAGLNKGVEELDQMMDRFISLGLKRGIQSNAKTLVLQMDYRINAGDLIGAQAAYESLQTEEILDNEDLSAINKYIRSLCGTKTVNYDRITSILADLEDRQARLEADTVSSLCMMYLKRGEIPEVVDLLQTQTFHYTLDERARIRDAFVAFCLDRNNHTSKVWDAYTVFRQIFEETDITIRTQMMNEFFARRRSDMACHVFGHMRQHVQRDKRPVLDTYIQCFEGIARCADRESLDIVHNMFKMDSSIEPSTRLYNSLMLAYTACDDADRALDFWDDITNSIEGPSYRSLEIVFRTCQLKPFGDKPAKAIWNKMRKMEIEITPKVFNAYAGALAGQGKLEEAINLVDGMEEDIGFGPNVMTLGTLYNAIPGQNRKDQIEKWGRARYPVLWAELEQYGQREMDEGHRLFKIVIDMVA
ncbi:hypothetical protein F5884DRAFT_662337 [Xylogone sp. PMI_703]|nr:hypothetical protein F5884DRAFT_662337 [Xylogone sp. PMI_703]